MLAESPSHMELLPVLGAIAAAAIGVGVALVATRYKRCPANRLLVVYGQGVSGGMHVQHGGARFVWPLIQGFGWLSLEPIQAGMPEGSMAAREGVRVSMTGDIAFGIGTSPEQMRAASERVLGLDAAAIRRVGADECAAALRELAARMDVETIWRERELFGEELRRMLDQRLAQYGMTALSVRLEGVSDESGLIAALEQEQRERLEARQREDAATAAQRKLEEAAFLARRAAAEAELAERHRREIEEERRELEDLPGVLKDDGGDRLKNM